MMIPVELEKPGAWSKMCDMLRAHRGPASFEIVTSELGMVFLYPGVRP